MLMSNPSFGTTPRQGKRWRLPEDIYTNTVRRLHVAYFCRPLADGAWAPDGVWVNAQTLVGVGGDAFTVAELVIADHTREGAPIPQLLGGALQMKIERLKDEQGSFIRGEPRFFLPLHAAY